MGQKLITKLICFGNVHVGKTSIIDRYVNNKFEESYMSTLGYNMFEKNIKINDNDVAFMIMDIGGQEQFENLRKKYAEGAKVAFLVYDITERETFVKIKKWYDDLTKFTKDAMYVLIGNKSDLKDNRKVKKEEGQKLAEEIKAIDFLETSAKTGKGVDEAFYKLAQAYYEKNK